LIAVEIVLLARIPDARKQPLQPGTQQLVSRPKKRPKNPTDKPLWPAVV
jgi:hypothetical protein